MVWLLLTAIVGSTIVVTYIVWRKWIAPWHEIERLLRQVGRGEQPRTFLVGAGKEAERVGVALEDILKRQRTLDRQLIEYASGQKAIFSAMQDGLLVVDAERHIALLNRTFAHWFGVPENSLGEPLIEQVRDPAVERLVDATLKNREAVQSEITVADRCLQVNAVPLGNTKGKMNGAVVLFHDITELKRVDDMRRDFVANVSHELRTPLSILRGYIETLREHPKLSRQESSQIVEVMERHSERLGLLVEDLLTLAQLESGNSNLQLSGLQLAKLFGGVMRDWENKFEKKQLKLIVDIPPDLPIIRADETRLRQVLDNLLDNAAKYSQQSGEIRLKGERRDDHVVLSVADNGIGIGREDLPRIFERFYRADKARSRELGGTGLGLAIVKHIAQLHGGRVEAKSELGRGTTIRVVLPLQRSLASG